MSISMTHELDQMLMQYRKHLQCLAQMWGHVTNQDQFGNVLVPPRAADDMLSRLELAVTNMMEKEFQYEKMKQEVLDLKGSLDISRQTVEAKSLHLGQEEKQKEEEQNLRFKEFKRIHRYQDEKAALEKELVPAKKRLSQLFEVLGEKSEKLRNLVHFHDVLSEHCEQGMVQLRQQTEQARTERTKWDRLDMDISEDLRTFPLDKDRLYLLQQNVRELNNIIQHHKQWYEEEMQSKLFYSTRSKEIKHKLAYYRSVLRRVESSGRHDDVNEDAESRRLYRRSENILVDGSPGVHAKEVERYLSRQFGVRVLADYTMLKRLKDEIGVQGLAYLVEKVRLQGSGNPSETIAGSGIVTSAPCFADWEEQRVEQALRGIALEYRDSDENKRVLQPSGRQQVTSPCPATPSPTCPPPTGLLETSQQVQRSIGEDSSVNSLPRSDSVMDTSGRSSSSSLRRKTSLARLKKIFKL